MKEKLKEILNALYEAEGLVEMALRRSDPMAGQIVELAVDKCFLVADLAAALELDKGNADKEVEEETDYDMPLYTELNAKEASEVSDISYIDKPLQAEEDEYAEEDERVVEVFANEIIPAIQADDDHTLAEPEEDDDVPAQEALTEPDIDIDKSVLSDMADIRDASIFDKSEGDIQEAEQEQQERPQENTKTHDTGEVKIENMKQCNSARPLLMSMFSINDKFRFRRELFSNSEVLFRDTISLLETMNDLPEACDYFYTDLGWDPENEDVKAFITVMQRYYK